MSPLLLVLVALVGRGSEPNTLVREFMQTHDPIPVGSLSTQPVLDMLSRVFGDSTASIFKLEINTSMPQGFTLSSDLPLDPNTTVVVSVLASGLPELAYGCGYYLRKFCHMSFSWDRTGGNQIAVPQGGFVHVNEPVSITKKATWSYYQNVCTQSYSMWWWDWARWEREIDWAALWGINLMLAYTGQEEVFRQVYNSIGVNDSILNNTFDGPAFLTWSRGQGTFGVGGPLPNYWIESQHSLQIQIMNRLRELGIQGILPGFQGNVPKEMTELFPNSNTSNGWLDGMDPLFDKIGRAVAHGMQLDFGPANFVEADGWFELQTGPWMASSEVEPQPDVGQEYGSCLGGFNIPSEEEAFARASHVFSSLISANPTATWVYQGYPWFRVYSQGQSCNQTALRHFIKGFTDAIPKDRLLVLDLIADSPGRALWKYPDDPVTGRFARNATLIWCALNNWGGAVHLGGDIEYVLNETRTAMTDPLVDGVGLTPEGIDNSPAYFSLVLDSPWTTEQTAADWLQDWGSGRCGQANVPALERAYDLLSQTVYRAGKPYLWCCSLPKYCTTVLPGDSPSRPDYNTSMLREALEAMLEAAPYCNTDSFNYDLVDVTREWLSMQVCLEKFDQIAPSSPNLDEQVAELLEVYHDTNEIMAADSGFLLGLWLKNSREVSSWDGSNGTLADFYEWNSRMQITTWAGGYSRREWSGMIDTYYAERLKIWLNFTKSLISDNEGKTMSGMYMAVPNMDCNFDDEPNQPKCHGRSSCSVSELEELCNITTGCIGFNYPGCILKFGCRDWKSAEGSTFYFKPGNSPPSVRSSCVQNLCQIVKNGTYEGDNCDNKCTKAPPKPSLQQLLDAFVAQWQNQTWTESVLPSTPQGNASQLVSQLLQKYPVKTNDMRPVSSK